MASVKARLRRRRRETAVAATLELDLQGAAFVYRPGQHLQIDPHQFSALAGALVDRAAKRGLPDGPAYFALSSDALDPSTVEITIKRGKPGGSPLTAYLLEGLPEGAGILIDGPGGTYGYPDPLPEGVEAFVHVCAGSGVTPQRAMIRHALRSGWPQRQLLILQERTSDDVLFASDWEAFRSEARFRFRPVYSQSDGSYLSSALLRDCLAGCAEPARAIAFVCGPNQPRGPAPGFSDLARQALLDFGFAPERILA